MTQNATNNTTTQSPETTTSNGKLQYPCTKGALINAWKELGWAYRPVLTNDGKPTRMAKMYVCPHCRTFWQTHGKSKTLAKRLATTAMIFGKSDGREWAACTCGWKKPKEVTAAPQPPAQEAKPKTGICQKPGCGRPLPKGKRKFCEVCVPFQGQASKEEVIVY